MDIVELLKIRGLDVSAKIKMLRHQSSEYDIQDLYRRDHRHFEMYQSFQGKPVLECQYIVSFLGVRHGYARFVGVYKVGDRRPASEIKIPSDYPYPKDLQKAKYWYDLTKCDEYKDFIDRVIIYWGKSERSWQQWLKPREIVEILPSGYVEDFPGFLELSLDYDKLKKIIEKPTANREWHLMLKSVAGIYLILDTETGMQYVGSAYGDEGILGRWRTYAETGHGGNKLLKELVNLKPDYYPGKFRFTILHTLNKSTTMDEVIDWERRFKDKLGTRAFGLNTPEIREKTRLNRGQV